VTLVCVPITVIEPHLAAADAEAAARAGADVVEFRFDGMFEGDVDAEGVEHAKRLVRECPLPVIATCRVSSEGGGYGGDDGARAELFEALIASDAPARWVDVELARWRRSDALRDRVGAALDAANASSTDGSIRVGLILSTHDFEGRPADLMRRLRAMGEERRASVHKFAYRARSLRDNLEIAEVLKHRERPTIALGMGEFGLMSRVLAPKWGGFLTFAALRAEGATAPGQPTIEELLGLYRFRSIKRTTGVYGVVGWPVAQSMSPLVHNAGFEEAGFDGVYLPMPVPPEWEHFKATVGAMAADALLDLRGLSVTAPHKQHLVRLAREEGWSIEARAECVGAANTVVMDRAGRASVHDTDGGAVASLLGDVARKRIVLLGAGGVARSIGAALVEAGAVVEVRARREEQAEELRRHLARMNPPPHPSHEWEGSVGAPDGERAGDVAAVVNCTSAGMSGGGAEGEMAIRREDLGALARENPGMVVVETVYRPLETALVRASRGLGLRVIDGASMFVEQAEGQFWLWAGRLPQAGLYDRLVRERLG
jgi:3-dehydroquinate dehydratase/shikimate dehydrogenase